jgi:3'(2'), 5'-bisphosphate nucleotidase / inositol polyphosphate 1-phosphatase
MTRATMPIVSRLSEAVFMESYESRHSDHSLATSIASALGFQKPPLRMDSQVKYGLLASGHGHMFLRFPPSGYRYAPCPTGK